MSILKVNIIIVPLYFWGLKLRFGSNTFWTDIPKSSQSKPRAPSGDILVKLFKDNWESSFRNTKNCHLTSSLSNLKAIHFVNDLQFMKKRSSLPNLSKLTRGVSLWQQDPCAELLTNWINFSCLVKHYQISSDLFSFETENSSCQ